MPQLSLPVLAPISAALLKSLGPAVPAAGREGLPVSPRPGGPSMAAAFGAQVPEFQVVVSLSEALPQLECPQSAEGCFGKKAQALRAIVHLKLPVQSSLEEGVEAAAAVLEACLEETWTGNSKKKKKSDVRL